MIKIELFYLQFLFHLKKIAKRNRKMVKEIIVLDKLFSYNLFSFLKKLPRDPKMLKEILNLQHFGLNKI